MKKILVFSLCFLTLFSARAQMLGVEDITPVYDLVKTYKRIIPYYDTANHVRYCGLSTQLSTRNVRQLMVCEYYDNSRAVTDLAMPQTPVAHAIEDFFNWHSSAKR